MVHGPNARASNRGGTPESGFWQEDWGRKMETEIFLPSMLPTTGTGSWRVKLTETRGQKVALASGPVVRLLARAVRGAADPSHGAVPVQRLAVRPGGHGGNIPRHQVAPSHRGPLVLIVEPDERLLQAGIHRKTHHGRGGDGGGRGPRTGGGRDRSGRCRTRFGWSASTRSRRFRATATAASRHQDRTHEEQGKEKAAFHRSQMPGGFPVALPKMLLKLLVSLS